MNNYSDIIAASAEKKTKLKYKQNKKGIKKMKKIICMIMAMAMIFALGTTAFAADGAKAVKTVEEGYLVMGTNASFPPYEFISDEDSETIVGIDAEIAGLIVEALGLELVIEDMEFSSIITAVQTGKIDIGMAGMTVTEERLKNVNFSTSYAKGVQSVIVPEGSPITGIDDLFAEGADYMIGVQESTTGHIYAEGDFGADKVVAVSNGALAVEALKAGKVDCVIIDNEPAKAYVAANEGLKILESSYADEDYAISISKDNEELLDAINAALEELIENGDVQDIIDKYIAA